MKNVLFPSIYLVVMAIATFSGGCDYATTPDINCVESASFEFIRTDTGNCSSGYYEDVATIKKVTGNFKCAFKVGTTPNLQVGSIYAIVLDSGTGGPYLSGNVRVNSKETPILNVQGGVHQSFMFTSQGSFYEGVKP